jgi:alpha-glucosidase
MEFAAFVPIDRVHGELNEKRQPWVYGPIAEQAAVKAIRLRYQLLPYIYSNEHNAMETGIGIVRPLFWVFPDDPQAADNSASWMFGDALLVSPVVTAGESDHVMYLPAGTWFDYFRGTRIEGGRTIHYPVDPKTWQDIPLFVRSGSILASRPVEDYVDQTPATEITLDVFAGQPCKFSYYDDDGNTYAYEQGGDYQQTVHAESTTHGANIEIEQPKGLFHSDLKDYIVRVHEIAANAVAINGKEQPVTGRPALALGQWSIDHDRFGPSTIIRVPANQATTIILRTNN